MLPFDCTPEHALPTDHDRALLVGRVHRPDVGGPSVVALRAGALFDVSAAFPTVRDLCESRDPGGALAATPGERIGDLAEVLANTPRAARDVKRPWLLTPIDLQAIKASGVTFVVSMLERVIEEQARGRAEVARSIRGEITAAIGQEIAALVPGSKEAAALRDLLVARGLWSQYLEVGIGPDAEIFTKAQPLSAVGHLGEVGIHPSSTWNNPEPEVVLVVSSRGAIVGATLGNDVNLRDVEGRSALLLGRAKDNTASAAVGPFVRLFDASFGVRDVARADITLHVSSADGYRLQGTSAMSSISRPPEELVRQTIGSSHQYPDGLVLYLGTMFAPIEDRREPGRGFTHEVGDLVTIASPRLGSLSNRVVHCPDAEPWTFGAAALMRNLAARGLLTS